jgi:hypothetical protein
MIQPQAFIAFVLQYWAYILIFGFAAAVAGLWRKLADSERRAAAEKEQTFFLSILYIIMRSGKTLMHALAEAAGKKEIVERLSREAAYLRREGERTTLAEAFRKYVHPSREFSLLVGSIGEDLENGFGVVEKLEKFLEQATARESERWSRYVGTVETLGEAVVSVILLVPLLYIVGTILGGFPVIYIAVIILLAASVFYVVSAASEPMHLVDLPRHITLGSLAVILVSGGLVGVLFLGPMFFLVAAAAGLLLLGWGLFVHFVYVRRAVAEGESAFLLLDGVAARLRAGYPIGRSLERVVDPRYARYAKAVSRGLELRPLNRFMRLSIETVKLARLWGLGAEAIGLMSRLAIAIYLSFTNARARMKLYDALAIASGAAIVAVSFFAIQPFTTLPPEVAGEVQRLLITPSLDIVLPSAALVAYTLGIVVGKTEDQTVAATWRAGASILLTLLVYWIASSFL